MIIVSELPVLVKLFVHPGRQINSLQKIISICREGSIRLCHPPGLIKKHKMEFFVYMIQNNLIREGHRPSPTILFDSLIFLKLTSNNSNEI